MINTISGDLVTVRHGIVAHQVNILGKAGSGVVTDIRNCFSGWYQEYKKLCDQFELNREQLLGTTQYFRVDGGLHVANLFAQFSIKPFNRNTDLPAFRQCLVNLEQQAREAALPVYVPDQIACVRGGMDWDAEVFPIIEEVFGESPVILYLVDYVKGQQL